MLCVAYPMNASGQDFVVGDIHGCFHLLEEKLSNVGFDVEKDRLFSVGDLVDRGPHSREVLRLLEKPWVHAIRGNHEQMFLDLYSTGLPGSRGEPDIDLVEQICSKNGMGWWLGLENEEQIHMLEAFSNLPVAAEVQTSRGLVAMIHGEVPSGMNWREFLRRVSAGCETTLTSALWGRERLKLKDESGVDGVGRVFCGHSIGVSVRKLGNVYFLDTGAFLSADGIDYFGLTIANLCAKTALLAGVRAKDSPFIPTEGGACFQGM